jgi:hypothetical protein
MELVKDAGLVLLGDTGGPVTQAHVEMAVDRRGGDAHLAAIGEFNGIANEVEEHDRTWVESTLGMGSTFQMELPTHADFRRSTP